MSQRRLKNLYKVLQGKRYPSQLLKKVLELSQKSYWAGPVMTSWSLSSFSFPANQMVIWFPRGERNQRSLAPPTNWILTFTYIQYLLQLAIFQVFLISLLSLHCPSSPLAPWFYSLLLYLSFFLFFSLVGAFTSHFLVRHEGSDPSQGSYRKQLGHSIVK